MGCAQSSTEISSRKRKGGGTKGGGGGIVGGKKAGKKRIGGGGGGVVKKHANPLSKSQPKGGDRKGGGDKVPHHFKKAYADDSAHTVSPKILEATIPPSPTTASHKDAANESTRISATTTPTAIATATTNQSLEAMMMEPAAAGGMEVSLMQSSRNTFAGGANLSEVHTGDGSRRTNSQSQSDSHNQCDLIDSGPGDSFTTTTTTSKKIKPKKKKDGGGKKAASKQQHHKGADTHDMIVGPGGRRCYKKGGPDDWLDYYRGPIALPKTRVLPEARKKACQLWMDAGDQGDTIGFGPLLDPEDSRGHKQREAKLEFERQQEAQKVEKAANLSMSKTSTVAEVAAASPTVTTSTAASPEQETHDQETAKGTLAPPSRPAAHLAWSGSAQARSFSISMENGKRQSICLGAVGLLENIAAAAAAAAADGERVAHGKGPTKGAGADELMKGASGGLWNLMKDTVAEGPDLVHIAPDQRDSHGGSELAKVDSAWSIPGSLTSVLELGDQQRDQHSKQQKQQEDLAKEKLDQMKKEQELKDKATKAAKKRKSLATSHMKKSGVES